jgi:hypothetical protein
MIKMKINLSLEDDLDKKIINTEYKKNDIKNIRERQKLFCEFLNA